MCIRFQYLQQVPLQKSRHRFETWRNQWMLMTAFTPYWSADIWWQLDSIFYWVTLHHQHHHHQHHHHQHHHHRHNVKEGHSLRKRQLQRERGEGERRERTARQTQTETERIHWTEMNGIWMKIKELPPVLVEKSNVRLLMLMMLMQEANLSI